MADTRGPNTGFGLVVGGIVLLALVLFLTTGGQLGGTKKVEGDHDLPQVTSPKAPGENVGAR